MPKKLSPQDALNRKSSGIQMIGTRIPVEIWKELARFGIEIGADSMTDVYREVLVRWASQRTAERAGLEAIPLNSLIHLLHSQGYVILKREDMEQKITALVSHVTEEIAGIIREKISELL